MRHFERSEKSRLLVALEVTDGFLSRPAPSK